jgi:hypothetical protein
VERVRNEKAVAMSDITPDHSLPHGTRAMTLHDGGATFSQVFTVAVFFLLGIQGLKFIAPWYDYLRLKGTMQESVNQAQLSPDGDAINAVLAKAEVN